MSNKSTSIGIGGLLGLILIVLKLTEVIFWSWWWVLAPFWIPPVLGITLLIFFVLFTKK